MVAVSSGAHKTAWIEHSNPWRAQGPFNVYGQSKLAQIMHMRELQRREPYLRCIAVTPGMVLTNIFARFERVSLSLSSVCLSVCLSVLILSRF